MAIYKSLDGTIIDTEHQIERWDERRDRTGNQLIGRSTKSHNHCEIMFLSDAYTFTRLILTTVYPSNPSIIPVSYAEAVKWFLENDYDIPPILFIQ
jgi:hypothetical protein